MKKTNSVDAAQFLKLIAKDTPENKELVQKFLNGLSSK
jgi:hypothetical protein